MVAQVLSRSPSDAGDTYLAAGAANVILLLSVHAFAFLLTPQYSLYQSTPTNRKWPPGCSLADDLLLATHSSQKPFMLSCHCQKPVCTCQTPPPYSGRLSPVGRRHHDAASSPLQCLLEIFGPGDQYPSNRQESFDWVYAQSIDECLVLDFLGLDFYSSQRGECCQRRRCRLEMTRPVHVVRDRLPLRRSSSLMLVIFIREFWYIPD